MSTNIGRRSFFKTALKVSGLALVAPALVNAVLSNQAFAQKKRGAKSDEGMPLVDPKDPVAKAVRYVEDAKAAPDSKGNNCSNCGFYKKTDARNGKEVGTCTIFAGKLVYGPGWCGSWNKKA